MTPDTCPTMDAQKRTEVETRAKEAVRAMHTCPSCNSSMVHPINWHEQGDANWHVELRCPECEWFGSGSYTQGEVDRYDEELDRGGQELMEDLRALTRSNMEDEADRFGAALTSNSILPEDF